MHPVRQCLTFLGGCSGAAALVILLFSPMSRAHATPATDVAPRTVLSLADAPWRLTPFAMGEGERRGAQRRVDGSAKSITVTIPNDVQLTSFVGDALGQGIDVASVNQQEWWYTRTFPTPKAAAGQQVRLVFDGVDYFADVWVNGRKLGTHEGAYTQFEYDITAQIAGHSQNLLAVRVTAPWKVPGRSHYEFMKGEYDETWDALPGPGQVVFPLGLHRDVRLELTSNTRIEDINVSTVSLAGKSANLRSSVHIISGAPVADGEVHVTLTPENFPGQAVHLPPQPFRVGSNSHGAVFVDTQFSLEDARLWWTWDLGASNLYRAEVQLSDARGKLLDSRSTVFGIRTIERDANLLYRINGKKLLMRGAWYAMSRLYPASTDRATYEKDLKLARNANMNHLVNYTVVEKDDFYDLADRLGILIFVELPFNQEGPIDALNDAYPRRQQFLDWSASEVTQIVKQLRNHPSIGVWAPVSEVTENSPEISVSWDKRVGEAKNGYNIFLARMQGVVEDNDVDALYFRSYCDFGEHHFWEGTFFNGTTYDQQFDATASFVSEYGAQALFLNSSSAKTRDARATWRTGAGVPTPINLPVDVKAFSYLHPWQSFGLDFTSTAIGLNVTRHIHSYDDYAGASQIYQAFIYGYAGDAYRRRAFAPINGIRSWMFKSFPESPVGGFGVLDTSDTPTRAYYEQKRTFAPVALSFALRTPLESVPAGTELSIPVWVSNIASTSLVDVTLEYSIYDLTGSRIWTNSETVAVAPYAARQAVLARVTLPTKPGVYMLRGELRSVDGEIARATSFLKVASAATRKPLRILVVGSPEWANPVADFAQGFGAKVSRVLTENTIIRPLQFPADAQDLRRDFDAIWLAGFNGYWREAPDSVTSTVISAVRAGTTLIHTGSFGSFHGGGDTNNRAAALDLTPLADLLPVIVKHENDVYTKSTFRAGKQPNPFAQDLAWPVAVSDKAPKWLKQVDFTHAAPESFHTVKAKGDSEVLLGYGDYALLATRRFGKGNVIAYTGFGPEGSSQLMPSPLVIDRALRESVAQRTFGAMTAIMMALASGEDPPTGIDSMIQERTRPLYESMLDVNASHIGTPAEIAAVWTPGPDGSVIGHVRITNGDVFRYGLHVDLAGPRAQENSHLALWSNQYFDLLPGEVADAEVTITRPTANSSERLWITSETTGDPLSIRSSAVDVPQRADLKP